MIPNRYEPGQRREPLPYVNPKPRVQPKPAPQPQYQRQQYRQPRSSGRFAGGFGRLLYFLFGAGAFTTIWFALIKELGTITDIPELDIFLWVLGVLIFFWGDILTDNNRRWAEKYCGLWGRKGGK